MATVDEGRRYGRNLVVALLRKHAIRMTGFHSHSGPRSLYTGVYGVPLQTSFDNALISVEMMGRKDKKS